MTLQGNEPRLIYLVKTAIDYIRKYDNDQIIYYDEAECDGCCLSDDLENELESGDYILKADVVKVIQDRIDELLEGWKRLADNGLSIKELENIKNQIKK